RELGQELAAVGELDVGQRILEQRARIAGDLLQDAEELPERAEALVELPLHLGDQQLVLLESGLELLAAVLLGGPTLPGLLEQLGLLRLSALEFLDAALRSEERRGGTAWRC